MDSERLWFEKIPYRPSIHIIKFHFANFIENPMTCRSRIQKVKFESRKIWCPYFTEIEPIHWNTCNIFIRNWPFSYLFYEAMSPKVDLLSNKVFEVVILDLIFLSVLYQEILLINLYLLPFLWLTKKTFEWISKMQVRHYKYLKHQQPVATQHLQADNSIMIVDRRAE